MVKTVCRDIILLKRKAEPATKDDKQIAIDLLDTLKANEAGCVGMAANMIGIPKAIIAVNMGFVNVAMFNPKIINKSEPYKTSEGCLSLLGVRDTVRYKNIEIEYYDMNFVKQCKKYSDLIAQIIQHEIDHLDGKII
ncbi:MAG: peptide deformylase [Lachnospiraceae bacterium]|nr:peptide deformylase [Lachnospiraceae bacterium]